MQVDSQASRQQPAARSGKQQMQQVQVGMY